MTRVILEVDGNLYSSPLWRLPPGYQAVHLSGDPHRDVLLLTIEGPFPAAMEGAHVSGVVYQQDGGRPDLWVWTYRGSAIMEPIPLPPIAKAA